MRLNKKLHYCFKFPTKKLYWMFFVLMAIPLMTNGHLHAQLDKNWVIELNGRCVTPNDDGSFSIDNIIAPDRNADFISDNCYRITGYRTIGLIPLYCYSDLFRFSPGQTTVSPPLTFSCTPPFKPVEIQVGVAYPNGQVSLSVGQSAQLNVVAVSNDGTTLNLSSSLDDCGPVYQSSNPQKLQVSSSGEITVPVDANIPTTSSSFITVEYLGISTTRRVLLQSDSPTTVVGQVLDANGIPAEGVAIDVFTVNGSVATGISNAGGGFAIPDVVSNEGALSVSATFDNGVNQLTVTSEDFTPIPGGYASAGVLHLRDLFLSTPALTAVSGSEVTIPVYLQSDLPVMAWSFGLCIEEPDPANPVLTILQATLGLDASNLDQGTGPDLYFTNFDSRGVWSLAVVNTSPFSSGSISLPPSSQLEVLTVTAAVNGSPGATVPLCFCDTLSNSGAPAVPLMVSTVLNDGSVINRTPATECGSVTVE